VATLAGLTFLCLKNRDMQQYSRHSDRYWRSAFNSCGRQLTTPIKSFL
jgi:hypothetical protein